MRALKVDLTGQRFGRLVVLGRVDRGDKTVWWRCRCDCNTGSMVPSGNLLRGMTVSCGCFKRQQASNRALKRIWGPYLERTA